MMPFTSIRKYLLTVILLLIPLTTFAEPTISQLANLLNSVRTMQANFSQVVYDNRGKPIQQSDGKMAMQRPGKFRWEVKKPIPQLIIANESRLWIYDPDLEQVTIRSLNQAAFETPALLLSHVNIILGKDYTVKPVKDNSGAMEKFLLIPKQADSMFASIQMNFVNKQIREMLLQDHLGHTTLIKFENIRTNTSLPAAVFVFKAPANVDIIDDTRRK